MRLHLSPPPLLLVFAGIRHDEPAYPGPPGRDEVAERLARHDRRAALRRSIVLRYYDLVVICVGTPLLVWYVITHPEAASPAGAGTLGVLASVITGARLALGKRSNGKGSDA